MWLSIVLASWLSRGIGTSAVRLAPIRCGLVALRVSPFDIARKEGHLEDFCFGSQVLSCCLRPQRYCIFVNAGRARQVRREGTVTVAGGSDEEAASQTG
jgi:hypothetical protein